MQYQRSKVKTYTSLLRPTIPGLLLYAFFAGTTIVLNQFEYIKKYLQLPHDLEFGRILAGWADKLLSSTIGEARTQTLVVGLFWAIVGLVVYLFLRGIAQLAVDLDSDLQVRGYVWPKGTDRYRPLRILAEQSAFRFVALIGLAVTIFGPLAAVTRGPIFVDFLGSSIALQFVFWFFGAVLVWHLLVIFLRLLVLRARLFG